MDEALIIQILLGLVVAMVGGAYHMLSKKMDGLKDDFDDFKRENHGEHMRAFEQIRENAEKIAGLSAKVDALEHLVKNGGAD